MEKLTDWFGNPISAPAQPEKPPKNENPCFHAYGPGPEGEQCKNCIHLIGICYSKTVYKCDLRKLTHGAATDHKVRWPACAKFERRDGDIKLYDGRG